MTVLAHTMMQGGAAPHPNIQEVFSADAYTGTGATQDIANGVNLDEFGGLVWIKSRESSWNHQLFDTLRGVLKALSSNNANAESYVAGSITSFNSNGFSLGNFIQTNENTKNHMSWTFRQAPRFFQIREISHTNGVATTIQLPDLETVGFVTIKRTDDTSDWYTWHKDLTSGYNLRLNTTAAESNTNAYISVSGTTVTFASGAPTGDYELCAWAHDPLGPSDNGLISCGEFTTDGSGASSVELGWRPQFVLRKSATTAGAYWHIQDATRGLPNGSNTPTLYPNDTAVEGSIPDRIEVTATGFNVFGSNASSKHIYVAIRDEGV